MNMMISSKNTKKYSQEEKKMIIMNLIIDNFFAFKNFHMNMSYPKKLVDSSIEGEFLKDRQNFRYKKVNILMGANATGKTSVGKMLMAIFNFIDRKESARLVEKIGDKEKVASFSMDFVVKSNKMYRLDVQISPEDGDGEDGNQQVRAFTRCTDINIKDSYEACAKKIEGIELDLNDEFSKELEKIEHIGWMFSYPSDLMGGIVKCSENPKYPLILDKTLRALDPSIKRVEKIDKVKNTYVVRMGLHDLIIQDGELIKENILSSGTKAGIDIAHMLAAILAGECGFYYCDEKFSYTHSEIEKAFLSVMIDGLKDDEQLFFTTHNTDVLDLQLPKHTYTFLKKDIYDVDTPIKCIDASHYLKRNTDSLRNAVDNDLFNASPEVELIYEIGNI